MLFIYIKRDMYPWKEMERGKDILMFILLLFQLNKHKTYINIYP